MTNIDGRRETEKEKTNRDRVRESQRERDRDERLTETERHSEGRGPQRVLRLQPLGAVAPVRAGFCVMKLLLSPPCSCK